MAPSSHPTPMTPERLEQIRARAEAATSGPWHPEVNEAGGIDIDAPSSCAYVLRECVGLSVVDSTFIQAARTDVPALVAEVQRLRAAVRRISADNGVLTARLDTAIADRDAVRRVMREELATRPTRAEVLRDAAEELRQYCPDHGDTEDRMIVCQCVASDVLTDLAAEGGPGHD